MVKLIVINLVREVVDRPLYDFLNRYLSLKLCNNKLSIYKNMIDWIIYRVSRQLVCIRVSYAFKVTIDR